ncbi:Lnb N-terminal periplasmic domain-containing protein [Photobacterium sp. J15]|uniref:Lnb N-terminal periplasmic domain-containing protein n=1 Tax=Photobacterium sp. J15 TaxID=265901 RepID=UPI0007E2E7AF|nr:DUF4105 domain-containing protein [Photobacterium sp. J15]
MLKPVLSSLLLAILSNNAIATESYLSQNQQAALASNLDKHPQWKKLLHYNNGESQIESKSFFLDTNGRTDPRKELLATIAAFEKSNSRSSAVPTQCQFPARSLWLKEQLGKNIQLPTVSCPEFQKWRNENQLESISLVFVTGYLGNPASFFGHLLMKFNKNDELFTTDSPLLDSSINFGADTGPRDNPVKYVAYGLLGGYNASFTKGDYYRHEFSYAENEQRELWEYELNLTESELHLLEAHQWELKDKQYRYYFLDGNCATQMANFIGIVLDRPLLVPNQPWDMPLDIFKSLAETEHHGQPLIKEIKKRESKFSRIRDKYLSLTTQEKTVAKELTKSQNSQEHPDYRQLDNQSKARVLNLLFDYYELIITDGDDNEVKAAKARKHQLMMERLQLPAMDLEWKKAESQPPHLAQNPQKLGLSSGYNNETGWFGMLSLRAAYYDYLSLETSRFKDSNTTFFDAEIKFDDKDVWLSKFDLFNVTTLNILQVDLFDDSRFAWSTRLTLEQKDLSCRDCERTRWYGGLGKAIKIQDKVALYAIPEVIYDISNYHDSTVGLGLGALYTANTNWKTHLKITPVLGLDKSENNGLIYKWENRFGNAQDQDIRLSLQYNEASEINLSYARYF